MCNTVFKKIPRKWLLPDDPPMTPLLQEMGGQDTSVRELPKPLLLYPHPVRAAACLYVILSVPVVSELLLFPWLSLRVSLR